MFAASSSTGIVRVFSSTECAMCAIVPSKVRPGNAGTVKSTLVPSGTPAAALTNVHRHSGSRAVNVSVRTDESVVVLTVQDFEMWILREVLDRFWKTGNVGVGLAGIRERLEELGGALEIESNLDGTILKATIPASHPGIDANDRSPAVPSHEARSTLPAD
jgi:hypothetical protein